jgi:alkylation response protein AidB-like acyl-CoA dehydrogenase
MDATGIDPAEFVETATRAARSCAGLPLADQARRLAENGLLGILAPEAAGGLGLGLAHAAAVVEAASAALLGFPLIEAMLLARALPPELAAPVAAGETLATIAWAGGLADGRAQGACGNAPGLAAAHHVLVRCPGGAAWLAVDPAALDEVPGLDADEPDTELRLPAVAAPAVDDAAWSSLRSDALVLRTAAMLGAAEAAMDLAIAHVSTRTQFGRPLVAFQAVRHALAREKLAVEGIRGALARSLAEGNAADEYVRRTAFAFAAAHAPAVAEGALQLHGGMGYTWDVPVHRHLRRIRRWEAEAAAPANQRAIVRTLLDQTAAYDWGDAA